ncbi:hypothetical protein [Blastococcus sp. CCUG 61487]|uniref:hypothetical protein n=1 Tax=Blastococcus sp. CCUG 61487 TaxID=1840703 RepID=UPI0010BF6F6B|nr:hypothetical protein [Blastococcus sp. CCUG 61487]TKJ28307.1 hypothetical protein A6V29_02580 [Blastococcus sp. CCUG 61487]
MSTDDGGLLPPRAQLLTGDEPIRGTPARIRDFWAWVLSDLRGNTVRPMMAEFLVAQALDAVGRPRVEWEAYDVVTPDGIRVEVKSSAYVQAWAQARPSEIRFGGLNGRTWDAAGYASGSSYNADVYVFALETAPDHESYDPLDLDQWKFWVLPRRAVEGTGQKGLALSRVEAMAGEPVPYSGLRDAVRAAAAMAQSPVEGVDLRGRVVRVAAAQEALPAEGDWPAAARRPEPHFVAEWPATTYGGRPGNRLCVARSLRCSMSARGGEAASPTAPCSCPRMSCGSTTGCRSTWR